MKFIQKVLKKAFFLPLQSTFYYSFPMYTCKKTFFLLLLHVKISIGNIDCRYIDTFEKYRYRYREVENIDIDIDIDRAILKNIDIDIDIDKAIPKISISIFISIRQFCKISISIKYRIDSNLAYRTGLLMVGCGQNQGAWHQPVERVEPDYTVIQPSSQGHRNQGHTNSREVRNTRGAEASPLESQNG